MNAYLSENEAALVLGVDRLMLRRRRVGGHLPAQMVTVDPNRKRTEPVRYNASYCLELVEQNIPLEDVLVGYEHEHMELSFQGPPIPGTGKPPATDDTGGTSREGLPVNIAGRSDS